MKKAWILSIGSLVLAALALPLSIGADTPENASKPHPDALAKKLLTQCARIKDGDIVQIVGGARDVDLLESLNVEAAKLGADTLLRLAPSDRTGKRLFLEVPAKYDTRTSPLGLQLAETVTATISIDAAESDAALADIPPERVNARSAASLPIMERLLKRNVRQVYLGNGLYPTEASAQQYGIPQAEMAKLFYGGLNVDYDRMQASGEAVRKTLASGRKVRLTTPEGTDVTMAIEQRPIFVSDGVLSDDKIKKGGAACQIWLPAGEVYLVPVPGTAEGKVVVERHLWEGKEIRGLTLSFKAGRLTEMTARSGLERLKALYDTAGAGKDELSSLDLGINPAVRLPSSSPGGLYMEAGTITVSLGGNYWAGGDNKCPFGVPLFLRGGTLQVDGKPLVQGGALQISR